MPNFDELEVESMPTQANPDIDINELETDPEETQKNKQRILQFGLQMPGQMLKTASTVQTALGESNRQTMEQELAAEAAEQARRNAPIPFGPFGGFGGTSMTPAETQGAAATMGRGLGTAGRAMGTVAKANALMMTAQPQAALEQLGVLPTEEGVDKPYELGKKQLPVPAQMASSAVTGTIEAAPKLGAFIAGTTVAPQLSPLLGASIFGLTEQGYSTQDAAIGAAIPYIGAYSGEIAGALAQRLGVSSQTALRVLRSVGHTMGPAAYLSAIQASEIANLPAEQQKQAIIDAVEGNIGFLLQSFPGAAHEFTQITPKWQGPMATGEVLNTPVALPQLGPPRPTAQQGRYLVSNAPRPGEVVVPETAPEPERGLSVLEEIKAKNARTKEQIQALFPQLTREQAGQLRIQAWGHAGDFGVEVSPTIPIPAPMPPPRPGEPAPAPTTSVEAQEIAQAQAEAQAKVEAEQAARAKEVEGLDQQIITWQRELDKALQNKDGDAQRVAIRRLLELRQQREGAQTVAVPQPAKPPILPKPAVPRAIQAAGVPETAPEPERNLTVLEEIRRANARTKEQILNLFPQLRQQDNARQKAAWLRDQAWGKQPEVPNASSQQQTKEVHGDLQPPAEQGPGQVPIPESGQGVQPQAAGGIQAPQGAQGGLPLIPPQEPPAEGGVPVPKEPGPPPAAPAGGAAAPPATPETPTTAAGLAKMPLDAFKRLKQSLGAGFEAFERKLAAVLGREDVAGLRQQREVLVENQRKLMARISDLQKQMKEAQAKATDADDPEVQAEEMGKAEDLTNQIIQLMQEGTDIGLHASTIEELARYAEERLNQPTGKPALTFDQNQKLRQLGLTTDEIRDLEEGKPVSEIVAEKLPVDLERGEDHAAANEMARQQAVKDINAILNPSGPQPPPEQKIARINPETGLPIPEPVIPAPAAPSGSFLGVEAAKWTPEYVAGLSPENRASLIKQLKEAIRQVGLRTRFVGEPNDTAIANAIQKVIAERLKKTPPKPAEPTQPPVPIPPSTEVAPPSPAPATPVDLGKETGPDNPEVMSRDDYVNAWLKDYPEGSKLPNGMTSTREFWEKAHHDAVENILRGRLVNQGSENVHPKAIEGYPDLQDLVKKKKLKLQGVQPSAAPTPVKPATAAPTPEDLNKPTPLVPGGEMTEFGPELTSGPIPPGGGIIKHRGQTIQIEPGYAGGQATIMSTGPSSFSHTGFHSALSGSTVEEIKASLDKKAAEESKEFDKKLRSAKKDLKAGTADKWTAEVLLGRVFSQPYDRAIQGIQTAADIFDKIGQSGSAALLRTVIEKLRAGKPLEAWRDIYEAKKAGLLSGQVMIPSGIQQAIDPKGQFAQNVESRSRQIDPDDQTTPYLARNALEHIARLEQLGKRLDPEALAKLQPQLDAAKAELQRKLPELEKEWAEREKQREAEEAAAAATKGKKGKKKAAPPIPGEAAPPVPIPETKEPEAETKPTPPATKPEITGTRIVATAVRAPDGRIISAPNKIHLQLYEEAGYDVSDREQASEAVKNSGFMTDKGEFVTQAQADELGHKSGQIERSQNFSGEMVKAQNQAKGPTAVVKPVETATKQKSSFDAKQAKDQKAYLLKEIDKAIADAPELYPGYKDPDIEKDAQVAKTAMDDKPYGAASEEWLAGKKEQLDPLFQKYGVPETHDELVDNKRVTIPYDYQSRVDLLKAAIEKANQESYGKVRIEIPGDGVAEVYNHKTALQNYKERAKRFPTTAPSLPSKAGNVRETSTKAAPLGDMSEGSIQSAAGGIASTDASRHSINHIWSNGTVTVSTDGRRMIVINKGIKGAKPEGTTYDPKTGKEVELPEGEKFPNWEQVQPRDPMLVFKDVDTERLHNAVVQAMQTLSDKVNYVTILRNPDGSFAITAESENGSYAHNLKEGARPMLPVNAKYLLDAINNARKLGNQKVDILGDRDAFGWHTAFTGLGPLVIQGKDSKSIVMPMRGSSGTDEPGGGLSEYDLMPPAEALAAIKKKYGRIRNALPAEEAWLGMKLNQLQEQVRGGNKPPPPPEEPGPGAPVSKPKKPKPGAPEGYTKEREVPSIPPPGPSESAKLTQMRQELDRAQSAAIRAKTPADKAMTLKNLEVAEQEVLAQIEAEKNAPQPAAAPDAQAELAAAQKAFSAASKKLADNRLTYIIGEPRDKFKNSPKRKLMQEYWDAQDRLSALTAKAASETGVTSKFGFSVGDRVVVRGGEDQQGGTVVSFGKTRPFVKWDSGVTMEAPHELLQKTSATKPLWEMSQEEFVEAAKTGKLHQATGQPTPGKPTKANTPLSIGEREGYSPNDIARFYLERRGMFRGKLTDQQILPAVEQAHNEMLADAAAEGKTKGQTPSVSEPISEAQTRAMSNDEVLNRLNVMGEFLKAKQASGEKFPEDLLRLNVSALYKEARRRRISKAIPWLDKYLGLSSDLATGLPNKNAPGAIPQPQEELSGINKVDVKADPRLDKPGFTRKAQPNKLIVQLRDLESHPVREIVLEPSGDLLKDAQAVRDAIHKNADSHKVSRRESMAVLTGPNGLAMYQFGESPNGMVWTSARQILEAQRQVRQQSAQQPTGAETAPAPILFLKEGKKMRQVTPAQASAFYSAMQGKALKSGSHLPPMQLYDANGKPAAYVSPNGNVWSGEPGAPKMGELIHNATGMVRTPQGGWDYPKPKGWDELRKIQDRMQELRDKHGEDEVKLALSNPEYAALYKRRAEIFEQMRVEAGGNKNAIDISASKTVEPETAPAPETKDVSLDEVRKGLDDLDSGEGDIETVNDLADHLDGLAADAEGPVSERLRDAVDKYREAKEEDFKEYGGRGDADQYEDDFRKDVEDILTNKEPADTGASAEGKVFIVMQDDHEIHVFNNKIAAEAFKIAHAERHGGKAELDERIGKPGETIQDVLDSARKVVGKGAKSFTPVYHEETPSGTILEKDMPEEGEPPEPPRLYLGLPFPALKPALKALGNLRGFLAQRFKNVSARHTLDQLADAADNRANVIGQQMGKRFSTDKSPIQQVAASAVIAADFHPGKLNDILRLVQGKDPEAEAGVRYAMANFGEAASMAHKAKKVFDWQIKTENNNGIDTLYAENYLPGIYDRSLWLGKGRPYVVGASAGRTPGTAFKKGKTFESPFHAMGDPSGDYVPESLRIGDLVEHRVRSGQRLINRKVMGDTLKGIQAPSDGRPIAADMITRDRGPGLPSFEVAPKGYEPREIIPGHRLAIHEDFTSLFDAVTGRRSAVSEFEPGGLPVGKALLEAGGFVKHGLLVFDTFHASRILQKEMFLNRRLPSYKKGYSLLEYSNADLNTAVQEGLITNEQADWIRAKRPIANELLRAGLNVGRIQEAMYSSVIRAMQSKVAGKLEDIGVPTGLAHMAEFNKWVFEKVTRGAMLESALIAFDRQQAQNPGMSQKDVALKVARDVNAYFGNIGRQGIFKSPTMMDLSRLAFLAPQWVESMARSEILGGAQIAKGAYDTATQRTLKVGTLGTGLASGLAAYVIGTQLVNLFTRGHLTLQNPEKDHKLDAWIPDVTGKGPGFFVSPLSVVAELTHDMLRYVPREKEAGTVNKVIAAIEHIRRNRQSPLMRATQVLLSGRDWDNQKIVGAWDRAKAAGWALAPTPIPLSPVIRGNAPEGQVQRQLTSSLGVKTEPAQKAGAQVHQMARDWMEAQTDTKTQHKFEAGIKNDFGQSDYLPLRRAIQKNDMEQAQTEYQNLLKVKKPKEIAEAFRPYTLTQQGDLLPKPIGGLSRLESAKFIKSLPPEDRELIKKMRLEQKDEYRKFLEVLKGARKATPVPARFGPSA